MNEQEREVMKLALEALEGFYEYGYDRRECFEHITAIKEALNSPNGEAQSEQRSVSEHLEPVGEAHLMQEGFTHCIWSEDAVPVGTKLYTTPPQRKCENCGEFGTCCLKTLAHDAQNKENT